MANDTPSHKPYKAPAGGWGAAAATAKVLLEQSVVAKGSKALLTMNKPGGFKCPSCAFPDDVCSNRKLDFCENGAKALAHEATKFRVTREFFARHTISELMQQSDYWLEMQGRLTEPMRYDAATDRYVPCSWDDAFGLVGEHLRKLDSPHQAEFYTSGRTANETAFLYAIFVREFGTNNFPDCSNMCHEPTSRGLPAVIGVGKGTVVLEDFEHAEALFIMGQNPGTNAPRMMSQLVEARKRGIPIVAINPMPERALIRFTEPQDIAQMASFGSTPISSEFVHIGIGGDLAFLKGMMKVLFEREAAGEAVLDQDFLRQHTVGVDALRDDALAQDWAEIVGISGISEAQIRRCADIYIRSSATIICYGMGITQHQQGSQLVQQIANLLLLRGNFVRAVPDTERAYAAMRTLDLTVGIATKLNRGHLVHGKDALLLPVIARSERIETTLGEQFVTIEDSMSNVTASRGVLEPASPDLLTETEIVCRMAMATLPDSKVEWARYIDDYDAIRDRIAEVYPEIYAGFNAKVRAPHGFHLDIAPRRRVWNTPNGKANILVMPGLDANAPVDAPGMLRLATVRSHDQFNTTIYSENDRYRGVRGGRMVLFMNAQDMAERGLQEGAQVTLEAISEDGIERRVAGLCVIDYPMPRGSIAGYFPELNPLIPLAHHDRTAGTPAAKSVPVRVVT